VVSFMAAVARLRWQATARRLQSGEGVNLTHLPSFLGGWVRAFVVWLDGASLSHKAARCDQAELAKVALWAR
jgi:hypothetical protein